MINFKNFIAEQLLYKRIHFKCECTIPLDFIGVIQDYTIENNEIVFLVDVKGKLIKIGENHPKMTIEVL